MLPILLINYKIYKLKLKDLKELPKTSNANIKNALFVGSTAELQKMLKQDDKVIEGKTTTPEEKDISDK